MLGIVILWLTVYLTGMLLCKIGLEKETGQLWIHLTGFFFLFLIQGVIFTAAQLMGWSFGQAGTLLAVVLGLASLASLIICRKELGRLLLRVKSLKKNEEQRADKRGRYLGLTGWLWLGIFLVLCTGMVENRQDALMETMQTSLQTDTLNQFHPFTGQPMELGVIFSKKLLTLPFWYGTLCKWTGFSPQDTVWVWGSFLTITFSLMAFEELAGLLFRRNAKKMWMLVVLLELLILSGDYFTKAAGYQLLFYGYAGETIVGAVALPMLLSVLYRLLMSLTKEEERLSGEKEGLKPWGALLKLGLILGASLFLAPLLWGPGLLIIGVILFVICLVCVRVIKKVSNRSC